MFSLTIRDDFRVEDCNPKPENTYKNKSLGVVWREWVKSFYLCTNALLYKRWRWRKRKLQDTDALEAKNDAYADDVSHNATCQGVCGGEAGGISCLQAWVSVHELKPGKSFPVGWRCEAEPSGNQHQCCWPNYDLFEKSIEERMSRTCEKIKQWRKLLSTRSFLIR